MKMVGLNVNLVKVVIKAIVYIILLVFFLYFYFIEEITAYLEKKTTFTTTYESGTPRLPNIILCSLPPYKPDKNGFSTHDKDQYEKNTYTMDKDFELYYVVTSKPVGRQKLNRGLNTFENFHINVTLIPSVGPTGIAMCHMISTNATQQDIGSDHLV